MKRATFRHEAYVEMVDAAKFYESRSAGLGEVFLAAVEAAVLDVRQNPERWPKVRDEIRRRHVAKFPYAVLYADDPDEILIVAVMHLHRRPGYWIERLR